MLIIRTETIIPLQPRPWQPDLIVWLNSTTQGLQSEDKSFALVDLKVVDESVSCLKSGGFAESSSHWQRGLRQFCQSTLSVPEPSWTDLVAQSPCLRAFVLQLWIPFGYSFHVQLLIVFGCQVSRPSVGNSKSRQIATLCWAFPRNWLATKPWRKRTRTANKANEI